MTEKQTIAKAGRLLCIDQGKYDDYRITGFFVALRDFDPRKELDEYLCANPEQKDDCSFHQDEFLASLLARGLLLEVEYGRLYLGAYSCHDSFSFTPFNNS